MNKSVWIGLLFLTYIATLSPVFGQSWEEGYFTGTPNQTGLDIARTHDGNVMMMGRWFTSFGITLIIYR